MRVQETALRLINVLAGLSAGRTYLLQDQRLVPSLIKTMCATPNDTSLRQNALGCLQKFSLRRVPQSTMIEAGVIEWILTQLSNHVKGVCASALCGELGTVCMRVFSACMHMCMFVSQHALVLSPAVPSARGGLSLQVPCLCLLMVDSLPWVWFAVVSPNARHQPAAVRVHGRVLDCAAHEPVLAEVGEVKGGVVSRGHPPRPVRVPRERRRTSANVHQRHAVQRASTAGAKGVFSQQEERALLEWRCNPCGAVRSAASKALLCGRVATT